MLESMHLLRHLETCGSRCLSLTPLCSLQPLDGHAYQLAHLLRRVQPSLSVTYLAIPHALRVNHQGVQEDRSPFPDPAITAAVDPEHLCSCGSRRRRGPPTGS
jgi:hypothetical protein